MSWCYGDWVDAAKCGMSIVGRRGGYIMSIEMKQQWKSYDVLKAMLALMGRKGFSASAPRVHQAVYNLAKKSEFVPFLGAYLFEQRGNFLFSKELQLDFSNMELAGLLSSPNPDFVNYMVCPKLAEVFETYVKPRFSEDEIEMLSQISKEFEDQVTSNSLAA
jgi:hypothetical protein